MCYYIVFHLQEEEQHLNDFFGTRGPERLDLQSLLLQSLFRPRVHKAYSPRIPLSLSPRWPDLPSWPATKCLKLSDLMKQIHLPLGEVACCTSVWITDNLGWLVPFCLWSTVRIAIDAEKQLFFFWVTSSMFGIYHGVMINVSSNNYDTRKEKLFINIWIILFSIFFFQQRVQEKGFWAILSGFLEMFCLRSKIPSMFLFYFIFL